MQLLSRSRHPVQYWLRLFALALCILGDFSTDVEAGAPFDFTRLVAHWSNYAHPDYLAFIDEVQPEVVQVGFYGAHFWSLAHTPLGQGYPAHFPRVGHRENAEWLAQLNQQLHRRGAKVIGHFNVKFLVGDPDGPEGPRGFFDFYRNHWDPLVLGDKPVEDPVSLLERDKSGQPISQNAYQIGGMREYWACLNNPAWQAILKRWVQVAVDRGVDGLIVNYFYRHDCHCEHCVRGFRDYLRGRFSDAELQTLGIESLEHHEFAEIGAWHAPEESTPLRREALRFSQLANKKVFDEIFIQYGRQLKPELLVAQWNHLGDFAQISGDERCMLPADLWAAGEDYLWYSTGGAANSTNLSQGLLGEATLQARYIRGASGGKPYTLGKYEHVRIRTAIAELAANGGCPMGFYTPFEHPQARQEIGRYYQFLHTHAKLYHRNQSAAEAVLLFPRRQIQVGNLAPLRRFQSLGRQLLDQHILFDVVPDDMPLDDRAVKYAWIVDPNVESATNSEPPAALSSFSAPTTVRVSASRPAASNELDLHFVNYHREERPDGAIGDGIQDEKPIPTSWFPINVHLPPNSLISRVEFHTPEQKLPQPVVFTENAGRMQASVPPLLVYGVMRVILDESPAEAPRPTRRLAAVVTEYRHNSHADVIVSRLLQTDTLDGLGRKLPLELVSLYVDQRPENDLSRQLAASHGFRLSETIRDALTLGTESLAVDGVLLIAEHGDYPRSATTNIQYPKRRFWNEISDVFRGSQRVVPVFIDKHLADNWEDAKFIYDEARALQIPLMAGSSLPVAWRRPATDVRPDKKLTEICVLTYHTTDAYGFHALECAQALAEQRHGGETGVREVQTTTGAAVWETLAQGTVPPQLLDQAWERLSTTQPRAEWPKLVAQPKLFRVDYSDGLRLHLLELNGAVSQWSASWRYADGACDSTLFWTQEGRPAMHFSHLLEGVEQMMFSGKPIGNVERTLLTSGTLDALLISATQEGRRVPTPYLQLGYQPSWRWQEPPYPPPTRPWAAQ